MEIIATLLVEKNNSSSRVDELAFTADSTFGNYFDH